MDDRTQKQFIFGLIFLIIIGAIGYGIVDLLFVGESTCFDNVKNGKEEGLDCGILACGKKCEPEIMQIRVISSELINARSGDYDFVAKIYNPNTEYGASRLEYSVQPFDRSGITYILPGQTKLVVVTSLKSSTPTRSAQLKIKNAQWEKLDISGNDINFSLQAKDYRLVASGSELGGILYNSSDYDFDKADVAVILMNQGGDIIGVSRTDIRTFLSKSQRGFKVSWPFVIQDAVVRQDIEATTNLFENSNFIKSYGSQEKFQKFY